ncbi:MAG: response regulator transcription factor [Phycicoccus sp.]
MSWHSIHLGPSAGLRLPAPRRADLFVVALALASVAVFVTTEHALGYQLGSGTGERAPDALFLLVAAGEVLPLVLRTGRALPALAVVLVAFLIGQGLGYPAHAASLAVSVAAYRLGRGHDARIVAGGLGVATVSWCAAAAATPGWVLQSADLVLFTLVVVAPAAAGRARRTAPGPAVGRASVGSVPGAADHDPPSIESLSPREREVLSLLGQGMTNAEIADALTVGRETVKSHVSRILAKLGLRDRTAAAIFAHRSGAG